MSDQPRAPLHCTPAADLALQLQHFARRYSGSVIVAIPGKVSVEGSQSSPTDKYAITAASIDVADDGSLVITMPVTTAERYRDQGRRQKVRSIVRELGLS